MITRRAAPLALICLLTGCGAIIHGTRQDITAQSALEEARLTINPEGSVRTTPATLNLERKRSYLLTFSSPGYESESLEIKNGLNGWVLTADILLGLVGVVVDGLTGSWYTLKPDLATVTLRRDDGELGAAAGSGPNKISIQLNGAADGALQVRSDVPVTVNVRQK